MRIKTAQSDPQRLDRVVAQAQRAKAAREQGYREQALKLYPWICGRCGREFDSRNVRELTVHHRDHNHDNNPPDGSNWELLCLYCHDNEHSRYGDAVTDGGASLREVGAATATYKPFAQLKDKLKGNP
ncbi:MAG: YajD family HNH nuclease [Candidatus Competibacteraceae bacterium]